MGFADLTGWDAFDATSDAIANAPGVFKDDAERAAVIGAIEKATTHEADVTKALAAANALNTAIGGGLRAALKSVPFLAGLLG